MESCLETVGLVDDGLHILNERIENEICRHVILWLEKVAKVYFL